MNPNQPVPTDYPKFGDLSREEQLALFTAWLDGKTMQWMNSSWGCCWRDIDRPMWNMSSAYRVKPLSKPSIDWSHVDRRFNALVTTSYGDSYLSMSEPVLSTRGSVRGPYWDFPCGVALATFFASFKPGECDWKDSLVLRPTHQDGA